MVGAEVGTTRTDTAEGEGMMGSGEEEAEVEDVSTTGETSVAFRLASGDEGRRRQRENLGSVGEGVEKVDAAEEEGDGRLLRSPPLPHPKFFEQFQRIADIVSGLGHSFRFLPWSLKRSLRSAKNSIAATPRENRCRGIWISECRIWWRIVFFIPLNVVSMECLQSNLLPP